MATKAINTYAQEDPASGVAGLGVDASNETKLFNLGSAAARDIGTGVNDVPDNSMVTTPTGMIAPFAMSVAPTGWLVCDGTAVSRTTYSELFTALGTTWGVGDGSLTFNVPDLRGSFLRGAGAHGTETDAGGTAFTGPAVGSYEDDQMQGHWHGDGDATSIATSPTAGANLQIPASSSWSTKTAVSSADKQTFDSDDANGTPRTGAETRPFGSGVYYCIKY